MRIDLRPIVPVFFGQLEQSLPVENGRQPANRMSAPVGFSLSGLVAVRRQVSIVNAGRSARIDALLRAASGCFRREILHA
jgi:hypothetical protein